MNLQNSIPTSDEPQILIPLSAVRKVIFWATTSTFTNAVNEGAKLALMEIGYEICNQCKGRGTVEPTRAICSQCQGLGATEREDL